MTRIETTVKAIQDFGDIKKGSEYHIEQVIMSANIVVVSDDKRNPIRGGVDPRYVFGISLIESVEMCTNK